jgi:hypothetical protein
MNFRGYEYGQSEKSMSVKHSVAKSSIGKGGRINHEIEVDKSKFIRKISKYDIDRGVVDFDALKKEKEKEFAENAKLKRELNS